MGPQVIALAFTLVLAMGIQGQAFEANSLPQSSSRATSFIQQWRSQLEWERALNEATRLSQDRTQDTWRSLSRLVTETDPVSTLDQAANFVRLGNHEQAISWARLAEALQDTPETGQRARDLIGFAALQLQDHALVLESLEPALDLADALQPWRTLWAAQAALATGRHAQARAWATRVTELAPQSLILHEARVLRAEAQLWISGGERQGIREVEAELNRYPEYPQRDRMQVELAMAEYRSGQVQAAATRLDRLLWNRPFCGRAAQAQALLDEYVDEGARLADRTRNQWLERGRHLRVERHWDLAEVSLLRAQELTLEARGNSTQRNEVLFELALNAYDSARFEDAVERMEAIEAAGGYGVSSFNRATWLARSLSRLDRPEEAWEVIADYYASRSSGERASKLAEFASDLGLWDRALHYLKEMQGSSASRSWELAFTQYLAGHHHAAEQDFEQLAKRATGQPHARYNYWRARSLEQMGQVDDALQVYEQIVRSRPLDYYGLQARNRIREWELVRASEAEANGASPEQAREARPGRLHWDGIQGAPWARFSELHEPDPVAFFRWGRPEGLREALQELDQRWGQLFPAATRANALLGVGAHEEARRELRGAIIEFRTLDQLAANGRVASTRSPITLSNRLWEHAIDNRSSKRGWWGIALDELRFPMPRAGDARTRAISRQQSIAHNRNELRGLFQQAAAEAGDDYMVRRFANQASLPSALESAHDPRWHNAIPRAYGPQLRESIEAYNMNPYLLWGLMIVESDMNPDSVSRADAYGLLQVIPKTGELVARGFGVEDFGIHDLLDPAFSLRYGTWYLNELLTKFRGQEMLAFVAYNAGPHQVARWLQWRGQGMAMDEFIETVPYDGARRYPMRILQHVATMRAINGLPPEVYVGNRLDPEFEDNIYY